MLSRFLKCLMALFYMAAGINHFINPDIYLQIMPSYLPFHGGLIAISGACEVGLGLLLLIPRYSRFAAWGIIALLVAIFPANVEMLLHPEKFPHIPSLLLWLRLPLQALLIAWAYRYTK